MVSARRGPSVNLRSRDLVELDDEAVGARLDDRCLGFAIGKGPPGDLHEP
jgi:hypothetical protein